MQGWTLSQQSSAVTVLMLLCSRKELTGECGDSLQALTCPTLTSSPNATHAQQLVSHSMARVSSQVEEQKDREGKGINSSVLSSWKSKLVLCG